jgi:hypothetical protein
VTKIEELAEIIEWAETHHPRDRDVAVQVYRYALEVLPELRALRWIPVEERLPEDEREVEIVWRRKWDDKAVRRHGFLSTEITLKSTGERLWQESVSGEIFHPGGGRVTHWREIGPGPEGGCNES